MASFRETLLDLVGPIEPAASRISSRAADEDGPACDGRIKLVPDDIMPEGIDSSMIGAYLVGFEDN